MICIIALVVFAVLGIFSASHRQLAKEAFDCVFRRLTFRPCTTGLDQRLKAQIVAKSLGVSPGIGQFVHNNFEALSWTLTILMLASTVLVAQGAYNLWAYGSCDPVHPENCVFTSNTSAGKEIVPGCRIPANGSVKIDYFYSETCPYCIKQEPVLDEFLAQYGSQIVLEKHCIKIHLGDDALCIAKFGEKKFADDSKLAEAIGLQATPTTVFNCKTMKKGVQPLEELVKAMTACQAGS